MQRKAKFALDRGGPKRVVVLWNAAGKDTQVLLDGQPLGPPIPDFAALRLDNRYTLPDGRVLTVRVQSGLSTPGFHLTLDGQALPGAINDPQLAILTATLVLWFVAGWHLLLGAVALAVADPFIDALGLGWTTLALGAAYAGLAVWWMMARARLSIIAALVLHVVATIVAAITTAQVYAIVVPILIAVWLWKSLAAVKATRASG